MNRGKAWQAQQIETAMVGIRRYLNLHPNASDSLRGVRIWLRDSPADLSEEVVVMALNRLKEKGEIEIRVVLGGAVVYARALRGRMQD